MYRRLISSLVLAAAAPALAAPQETVEVGRKEGQILPDLELPTIDGARTLRLSDFRGRKLLLIEFASW